MILAPTPGVTGIPGEVGVPGEFGGIEELGDNGTWLRITSSSSVGEVASVFTVEDRESSQQSKYPVSIVKSR